MKTGRPTDYTPELVEKAKEYLATCEDEEVERSVKGDMVVYKIRANLPTVEGLAVYLGVARSTLYLWAKEHDEFSDIFEEILAEQSTRLINNGLSGDYNPTITKLMLSKHGYRESSDVTTDGKAIQFTSMAELPNDELESLATGGKS